VNTKVVSHDAKITLCYPKIYQSFCRRLVPLTEGVVTSLA
jgi:hypothetical protein